MSASRIENYKQVDPASVLEIRLNTNDVLHRVKVYLSGKVKVILYDDKGKPYEQEYSMSKQKANDEGIQQILSLVENVINAQTVQGNFTFEQYQNYVSEAHDSLLTTIMVNLYNWEISEDDYEPIVDNIMLLLQPFISRLIDNEERNSYGGFKVAEQQTHEREKGGLFNK